MGVVFGDFTAEEQGITFVLSGVIGMWEFDLILIDQENLCLFRRIFEEKIIQSI